MFKEGGDVLCLCVAAPVKIPKVISHIGLIREGRERGGRARGGHRRRRGKGDEFYLASTSKNNGTFIKVLAWGEEQDKKRDDATKCPNGPFFCPEKAP